MTDTPASVRQDLYDVIRPVADTGRVQVLDLVPTPGNARSPLICIDYDGFRFDEVEWTFPLRLYVRASDAGTEQAQRQTEDLVGQLDAAIGAESWRLTGQVGYLPDMDCWVGDFRVLIPRVL